MYKSKYRPSFKRKLARLYLEEMSSREVGKKFNITHQQIRYWGRVFSIHGEKAFEGCLSNPSATDKLAILQAMWTNDWSLMDTSAKFNLSSPGILFKWQSDYNAMGLSGLKSKAQSRAMKKKPVVANTKPSEDMSEKELRDELEYLRAENAVLKKLEALAQQKRAQAKKKL